MYVHKANCRENFLIPWCFLGATHICWIACRWDLYPSVVPEHDNTSPGIWSEFFPRCDALLFLFQLPRCIVKRDDVRPLYNAPCSPLYKSLRTICVTSILCIDDSDKFAPNANANYGEIKSSYICDSENEIIPVRIFWRTKNYVTFIFHL